MGRRTKRSSDWIAECGVVLATAVLIGSFGIPGLGTAMERTRANEAVEYLTGVRLAQERHRLRHGRYADEIAALDLHQPPPAAFRSSEIAVREQRGMDDGPAWMMTLTRRPSRLVGKPYTVTFTEHGFDPNRSSVSRLFYEDLGR